jgi:hypothetical protein
MNETFPAWAKTESVQLGIVQTAEALRLGLITRSQTIKVRMTIVETNQKPTTLYETVYPAILTDTERQRVRSLSWQKRHRTLLEDVLNGPCQPTYFYKPYLTDMNIKLREKSLEWRLFELDDTVYLSTITKVSDFDKALGAVRYRVKD